MKPQLILNGLIALPLASAHLQMSWPYPFRSTLDPDSDAQVKDYNMMAPLQADGSNFPCKGYHKDGSQRSTAKLSAGDQYTMTLKGSATHNGGSCQLSLSYDNGETFKVIRSMIGGCPLQDKYDFTIPDFAPSGTALFAWSWMNHNGNREYYMNCAQVEIENSSLGDEAQVDGLPNIWVGNLAGINSCRVPEGTNAVFPNPGSNVFYGDGESSSSQAFPGQCEYPETSSAQPSDTGNDRNGDRSEQDQGNGGRDRDTEQYPQWSSDRGSDENSGRDYSQESEQSKESQREYPSSAKQEDEERYGSERKDGPTNERKNERTGDGRKGSSSRYGGDRSEKSEYPSKGGMFVETKSPPSGESKQNTDSRYYESGNDGMENVPTTMATSTVTTNEPTSTAYATGDKNAYLPCMPGKLLCTGENTFATCLSKNGATYYSGPRDVAEGMACLPYWGQRPGKEGSDLVYRDDRYVRARPLGDCETNGSLRCADAGEGEGSGFWICDQGGWIDMGAVAKGTMCMDGEIMRMY